MRVQHGSWFLDEVFMKGRTFITLVLLGGALAGTLFGWGRLRDQKDDRRIHPEDWDRRVLFVCCDDHGGYSPAVYMRVGGGRAAFDTVREAAPFMRAGDPGSAAAGLC